MYYAKSITASGGRRFKERAILLHPVRARVE